MNEPSSPSSAPKLIVVVPCYNEEDMLTLNTLYTYAEDERIRKKAAMSMDMLLLDMVVDSHWGKYGGAHGR